MRMKIAGGSRPTDATPGSGLDVTSNEWARFAEARTVRAGGADPPCNPIPPHFRSSRHLAVSGHALAVPAHDLTHGFAVCKDGFRTDQPRNRPA